jgi:hypothetical protein
VITDGARGDSVQICAVFNERQQWIANAPNGASGDGTITVLDPQGFPLAGAPDPVAGGVFAGDETNRVGATHGLTSAALGTAILTKSPDLTGRAVFAAVEAEAASSRSM